MDECPDCGCRLPYFEALRNCLYRREVPLSCPDCLGALSNRTPLLGTQALWIGGGVVVVFGSQAGSAAISPFAAAGALAFWITSFWIAAPWLCRFEMARASTGGSTRR